MKICSLSSGSKGNCTYIEGEERGKVLVDIGISLKFVQECFIKLNVLPERINAIIITHEHNDHIKGVEAFSKKYDTPIFCPPQIYNLLCLQMPSCVKNIQIINSDFCVEDLRIFPFQLSHDSTDCYGYRIADCTGSVSLVTDTGVMLDQAEKIISGSSIVFLESNYDPDMLFACAYPVFLKKRIMSNRGHLSNLDCAKIILRLIKGGTKMVVLSHISENSNTPMLAYNTIKNYLENNEIIIGKNIKIGINYQNKLNSIYKLTKKS